MAKEKFNPIAQLPELPGSKISESLGDPIKLPPMSEEPIQELKKPHIEIRLKKETEFIPPAEDEVTDDASKKRLMMIRVTILISLIVLVLAGILLTIQIVPKAISGLPKLDQSFNFLFTSKTATSTVTSTNKAVAIPAIPKIISTSTPNTTAPARLIVSIIGTEFNGYQTVVRFNVQNVGGSNSGPWSFSANLPSRATPVYNSTIQSSLTPLSGVIFTLGFIADGNRPPQIILHTNQGEAYSY